MGFWTKEGIGAIIAIASIIIARCTDYLPGMSRWIVAIAAIMYIGCYVKLCYDQYNANIELVTMVNSKVNSKINGGK